MIALLILQAATVTLPYPWLEYCARTQDRGCVVETITPLDLAYINKLLAETIATKADSDPLDPWIAFPPDRQGDCDDHTVTARAALIALGMDPKALTIALGEVTEPDGRKVGHAVLIVTLDGRNWIIDRKTPDRVYTAEQRPYAWTPLATQPQAGVTWSHD